MSNLISEEEKIHHLLEQFQEHRSSIEEMIRHLEKIREKIDSLIPDSLDNRYIRLFEEKVKSLTALFSILLDMRKEISKSLKDEIELRRKIKKSDDILESLEDMIDIRSMASKIEEFKEKASQKKLKRFENLEEKVMSSNREFLELNEKVEGM